MKFNIFNKAILIAASVAAITTCVASAGPSKTQSTAKKITLVGTGNPNDPDPDKSGGYKIRGGYIGRSPGPGMSGFWYPNKAAAIAAGDQ